MSVTVIAIVLVMYSNALRADEQATDKSQFYDPIQRQIAGWTVKVDPALLADEQQELCAQAMEALANHLQRICYIVPADRVEKLQAMPIWLELHNEKLGAMQYHPDRGWLLANGHDPRLVKHVHIPRAKDLIERRTWAKHPYVVLHELAHAFHDQVLGFENAEVNATFDKAKEQGIYDEVLLFTGKTTRHYALTNPKEYFAESTEAYFGVNDFYPFVRAELRQHDPEMFALLERVWGKVPQ
ncbi:MAG: metallopeptidase [Planctomycetales bacterium]|nr:metallopeptidase [Planctomycetales bacterium]